MSKLVAVLVGLVVLVAAGPTLVAVLHALVPLVATVGVLAVIVRAVWFYTR